MVAYWQPVMPDVNVFDKDAAVGAAVGARVSPELVGGGVGACVVAAQAGAQPDRVGAHPLTSIRTHAACTVTQSEFCAPQIKIAHVGSNRARYMHAAHSSLLDCASWRSVCLSDSESAP